MAGVSDIGIKPVNGVQVISLADNSIDLLSSPSKGCVRPPRHWTKDRADHLIADHGFSMLVTIQNKKKFQILFDTGSSPETLAQNINYLNLKLNEVDCIVLSHGHWDHVGGLSAALKAIGKKDIPVIVHKNMFRARGTESRDGKVKKYQSSPLKERLEGVTYVETEKPFFVGNCVALVTGEIPRINEFEKGYSKHRAFVDGSWVPDPLILDDRALVMSVKNKGLVVVSGCAHAGIINTVQYAQKITKTKAVYAIIGGFHLAGKENETRTSQTVEELRCINPKLIVPSHCTGWRGINAILNALPDAFVNYSVGNLYSL